MKKELDYINIEGAYGGNQNWFKDFMIRFGGCAAISACDTSIYLAATFPELLDLSPIKSKEVAKEDFMKFGKRMKKYLRPRATGISKISLFEKGFSRYAESVGTKIEIDALEGTRPYEEAEAFVKTKIDEGICISYLLLRHKDKAFEDFTWHWFTLTGYEMTDSELFVFFSSWGKNYKLPLKALWNTGYRKKGGMVALKMDWIRRNALTDEQEIS